MNPIPEGFREALPSEPVAAGDRLDTVLCGECDGTGWTEGGDGMTLGVTCDTCAGWGRVGRLLKNRIAQEGLFEK